MHRLYARLRLLLSVMLSLALLLPNAALFAPSLALAQSDVSTPVAQVPENVPTPFPVPDWPESPALQHTQYTPSFEPLPAPAYTMIDPEANGAALRAAALDQAAAPVVDTEAGKTGVVVGAATATLTASSSPV